MASIEYVVNATGNLSAFLEKAGLTVDHLDSQLEDLSKRIATPEVDLKDTKFTLGMVNAAKRLDKLSAMIADPEVDVDTERAQVEILRVNAMLDRLDKRHVTATVDVNVDRGFLSRLRGLLPSRGGGGGDVGGILGGIAGLGGGSAQGASGFAGSLGQYGQPALFGGLGVLAALLGPALLPATIGLGAGGGAVLGGAALGQAAAKQMQALAKQLATAKGPQAKLIRKQMADIQKQNAGPLGILGGVQDIGAVGKDVFSQALSRRPFLQSTGTGGGAFGQSFMQGLIPVFKQIQGFIKSIGPDLAKLFQASLPFLKTFVGFMEQLAKTLLPVFTTMLKQMTPFLPLIGQGLTALVQGLADMFKAIGPRGMQASAEIFVGLMKAMGWALTVLGKIINFLAVFVAKWAQNVANGARTIAKAFDTMRHDVAVTFDRIRHNFATWADDGLTIFRIWRDRVELVFLDIGIKALKLVDAIVSGFAKLPGPLGKPFRDAKKGIDKTLHDMEVAAAQTMNRIQGSFDKLHNKRVTLDLYGSGKWAAHTRTEMGAGGLPIAAGGMFVGAGSTPTADDVLIRASRGELVVPARMVSAGMVDHLRGAIPGFTAGGIIPRYGPARNAAGMPPWIARNEAVTERQIIAGEGAAFAAAWKKFMDGSGAAIARYAMRFIGRIPYVWGGTAVPGGADCSGFSSTVYSRFGINAPRTSEAQGSWVRRGPPVPGGLAFYHSPPGGPDPGHVAIVGFGGNVISQGGGMGPQLMGLHSMPLLWTGTPPGGFGRLGGGAFGGSTPGSMSGAAIARLWTSLGGPAFAAANMARIAFSESGDRPGERQTGMPPGLTGWGLYQITPTSGITQNGRFGNLLNASNNTRAAISLFSTSGYAPWASDPVGRALLARSRGFDHGGWLPPGGSFAWNGTGRPERVLAPGEGGSVYNITVSAGPLAHPAETGRAVVTAIKEYEKRSGPGWRR